MSSQFPFKSVELGVDLSQKQLDDGARVHNLAFFAWTREEDTRVYKYVSIEWLLDRYQKDEVFLNNVAARSRADYKRLFATICAIRTKDDGRFGDFSVSSVSHNAAKKIYKKMIDGEKFRRGQKCLIYMSTAWKRMYPIYPKEFNQVVRAPWSGVPKVKRQTLTKAAVTREEVYLFVEAAIATKHPEAAAVAVICFEWLQRPENAIEGHITWNDYRGRDYPDKVRIVHRKTTKLILHSLQEETSEGVELLYPEAEAVLARVPR